MQEGDKRKVYADSSVENCEKDEVIGYVYQSRQYSSVNRNINPLYISSGHEIGPKSAVDIVSNYCGKYKLPTPIRIADERVSELKSSF